MNIAFRMRLQINHQRVGALDGVIQIVIYRAILKEHSQGIVLAVHLRIQASAHFSQILRELIDLRQSGVHLIQSLFHMHLLHQRRWHAVFWRQSL